MRIHRRLAVFVLALALSLSCVFTGSAFAAHSVPDASQTGTVSATMKYGDEAVGGGTVALYKVGDVAEDDGNYSFALSEAFAGSGASLDDLEASGLADTLAAYAADNGLEAVTTIDIAADGTWTASGLVLGLYLVVQYDAADGYEAISPFLVSVPMYDEAAGVYVYDINVESKVGTLTEAEVIETEPPATTVTDTTLPQTGQLNWPIPFLAIAGMGLILIGLALRSHSPKQATCEA